MVEDEFLNFVWKVWQEYLDSHEESDLVIDHVQYERLRDLFEFLADMTGKLGGRIEPVFLEIREIRGGITVEFPTITFKGDDLKRFCEVTKHCSGLGFDCCYDEKTDTYYGVCASFTIPDIFVPKV